MGGERKPHRPGRPPYAGIEQLVRVQKKDVVRLGEAVTDVLEARGDPHVVNRFVAATYIENPVGNGGQPLTGQHSLRNASHAIISLDHELAVAVVIESHVAEEAEVRHGRPGRPQLHPLEILLSGVAVYEERPHLRPHDHPVSFHVEVGGLQAGPAVQERALQTHFVVRDVLRVQSRVYTGRVESRGYSRRFEGL